MAKVAEFTAIVHATGKHFWIPEGTRAELGIMTSDFRIGLMIFDDADKAVDIVVCETTAGGQVKVADLKRPYQAHDEIRAAAFIPHMAIQIWGPATK